MNVIGFKHTLNIENQNDNKRVRTEIFYQSNAVWTLLPSDLETLIFDFAIEGMGKAKYRGFGRLLQVCKRWYERCLENNGLKHHYNELLDIAAKYKPYSNQSIKCLLKCAKIDLLAKQGFRLNLAIDYGEDELIDNLLTTIGLDSLSIQHKELIFKWAIKIGRLETVKSLLTKLNTVDHRLFIDFIKHASECGRLSILQEIVDHTKKAKIQRIDPSVGIKEASKKGNLEVLNFLLENCPLGVRVDNSEALLGAIQNGHVETVKRLIGDQRSKHHLNHCLLMKQAIIDNNQEDIAKVILTSALHELTKVSVNIDQALDTKIISEAVKYEIQGWLFFVFGTLEQVEREKKRFYDWWSNNETIQKLPEDIFRKVNMNLRWQAIAYAAEAMFLGAFSPIEGIQAWLANSEKASLGLGFVFLMAIKKRRIEVVQELLNNAKESCLLYADEAMKLANNNDFKELFELLLIETGKDPSINNNEAIILASLKGNKEIVKMLLKDPRVDPSAMNNEAIRSASTKGYLEVLKLLLNDSRVDPSAVNNEALRMASGEGYIKIVEMLLKDPRVDPRANNNEAIRLASEIGSIKVVESLLADSRVDPSAVDNEALRAASGNGNEEVVKLLLKDPRVDPTTDENDAIRVASENGYEEVVKLLLKDPRVDPAAKDNEAIRLASKYGYENIVKLLLKDRRVNPAAKDNEAIRLASKYDQENVVKLLLDDPRVKLMSHLSDNS